MSTTTTHTPTSKTATTGPESPPSSMPEAVVTNVGTDTASNGGHPLATPKWSTKPVTQDSGHGTNQGGTPGAVSTTASSTVGNASPSQRCGAPDRRVRFQSSWSGRASDDDDDEGRWFCMEENATSNYRRRMRQAPEMEEDEMSPEEVLEACVREGCGPPPCKKSKVGSK